MSEPPPHPAVARALKLNGKAAHLQERSTVVPGVAGRGIAFRAELVRTSIRLALAEVVQGFERP